MELAAILESHRKWLHDEPGGAGADLTGADLSRANLTGANLTGADLSRACLTGACLSRADLSRACLTGADLSRACLSRACLSRACLTGANLTGADLSRACLTGANLTGADLSRACLSRATMPSPVQPKTLVEAARLTREWLRGRWIQKHWILTPHGAYAGDCKACLHGAAVYVGGNFGPQLADLLDQRGKTTSWNDDTMRTEDEVCAALEQIEKELLHEEVTEASDQGSSH